MTEEIGKHKGAVETLLHEKKELSRLLQIVNSQLERHLGALEEKGVDTDQFIQQIQQGRQEQSQGSKQQENRSPSNSGRKGSSRSQGSGREEDNQDAEEFLEDDSEDRDFSPL